MLPARVEAAADREVWVGDRRRVGFGDRAGRVGHGCERERELRDRVRVGGERERESTEQATVTGWKLTSGAAVGMPSTSASSVVGARP